MKTKYVTAELRGVDRIMFSRDEMLYMINSLGDSEQEAGAKAISEHFISELERAFE